MALSIGARRMSNSDYLTNYAADSVGRLAYNASKQATNALKRKFQGGNNPKPRKKPSPANRSRSSRPSKAAQLNTRLAVQEKPSRKKAKKVGFKKKKYVKVNKLFRSKVAKALEPRRVNGLFELSDTQYIRHEPDNEQGFFYLGKGTQVDAFAGVTPLGQKHLYNVPWFFDPLRVAQLASWGWNGHGVPTRNADPLADGFLPLNGGLKIHLKKSWVTFNIKNNTERTWYMKMFVVAPKKVSTNLAVIESWCKSLVAEEDAGTRLDAPWIYSIDEVPTFTKELNNYFKFVKTDVTLEPGQSFDYNLPGPEDITYDYEKYWDNAIYQSCQKMLRTVLVTIIPDLQVNYDTTAGTKLTTQAVRMAQSTFNKDGSKVGGICIDYREFYDISMPEVIGGTKDATDNSVLLEKRIDVKGRHSFNGDEEIFAHEMRVDAENPNYNLDGQ